jgi:hypothetical protein
MGHVDEELEGQAESVLNQPCRDENSFGRPESRVAVADRAVPKLDRVGRSNHGLAGIGDGQRNKIIGAVRERGRHGGRHSPNQML